MPADNRTAKFEKFMENNFAPKAERLIERLAKDAENRPLIANVACLVMALMSLHSLSAVPLMWAYRDLYEAVPQVSSYLTVFILGAAVQAVAAFGLYRSKTYGMHAVALSIVMDVIAGVTTGAFDFVGAIVSGFLFYFLWLERAKFSKPSLPVQE